MSGRRTVLGPPRRVRLTLAGVIVAIGVPHGLVWAWVAPGTTQIRYPDGTVGHLPTEHYHSFVDLAVFSLLAAAVGMVCAVAAWRIRAIRGPATLLTLAGATTVAGAVAYLLGPLVARGDDPSGGLTSDTATFIELAPSLATPLVLVVAPLVAVLVYTFLAAWDGRPDLGRSRPAATPADPVAATAPPAPAPTPTPDVGSPDQG